MHRNIAVGGVVAAAVAALAGIAVAVSAGQPSADPNTTRVGNTETEVATTTPEATTTTPTAVATELSVDQPADPTEHADGDQSENQDGMPDTGGVNQPPPPIPADQAPETAPNNPAPPVDTPPSQAPVEHPVDNGPDPEPGVPEQPTSDVG